MEDKKRESFTTKAQRNTAQKKYISTEKGKKAQKKAVAKSQAKKFINEFATIEELTELQTLITSRIQELKGDILYCTQNLRQLRWRV